MAGVLDGVRVVEVAMWAYVPAAGAVLAEWGAEVIKIEGPTGDPVRGLVTAGVQTAGPTWTWEMWNRGKRGISLDLTQPEAQSVVHQLVAEADVFLTSILPGTRPKLGIDLETIRAANPDIIYAAGTAVGPLGPECGRSGYDSITFWSRGSVAESITPAGMDPIGMPAGAFGDSQSGMALAGGIAAALVKKARTGEGSIVEGALFASAMWAMQMSIVGAAAAGLDEMPKMAGRHQAFNPLVNNYPTADGRWVSLCMLQPDLYWEGFCRSIGRDDLVDDPRFADSATRAVNVADCVSELDRTFLSEPLDHWRQRLSTQRGQWDVMYKVSDLLTDEQVLANGYIQNVGYEGGNQLSLVTTPVRFDREIPVAAQAPEFGADTDAVLESLGWETEAIVDARVKGAVV